MKIVKFLLLALLLTIANSKEYKAVFDCSSSDAHYIKSRMWLIGKTIDMIEKNGDKASFVLTLHGNCVPMISSEYKFVVNDEDIEDISIAQKRLEVLAKKKNVKVIACAMSLQANAIDKTDVLSFVEISPNSFIDTIAYQNDGYALMSFK